MIVVRAKKKKIGQCYRNAFELLEQFGDGWRLVHGYPRLTEGKFAGRKFGHAWIEDRGREVVIDSQGNMVPASLYYSVGRINDRESATFTLREARRLSLETESYGPWGEVPADAIFADDRNKNRGYDEPRARMRKSKQKQRRAAATKHR